MAMVDNLAARLSELTGSKFTVLRFGKGSAMRYGLRADRNGQRYFFQHSRFLKYRELTRWLATICDMVNMGYIPVLKTIMLDPLTSQMRK